MNEHPLMRCVATDFVALVVVEVHLFVRMMFVYIDGSQ